MHRDSLPIPHPVVERLLLRAGDDVFPRSDEATAHTLCSTSYSNAANADCAAGSLNPGGWPCACNQTLNHTAC